MGDTAMAFNHVNQPIYLFYGMHVSMYKLGTHCTFSASIKTKYSYVSSKKAELIAQFSIHILLITDKFWVIFVHHMQCCQ